MYVCLCNALTDRRLKQAMADTGSASPRELYEACGCRAQCGKCLRAVVDLVRDQVQSRNAALQGAD